MIETEKKKKIEWADYFPQMEAFPTRDKRIFQTEWKKEGDITTNGTKTKTFFCCIVGGDCYGVDVIRKFGVDARQECNSALAKVKAAIFHYETHGKWPKG